MNLKDLIKEAYFHGKSIPDIAQRYSISQVDVAKNISEILEDCSKETISVRKYIRILCNKERPGCIDGIHKGEVVYADIFSLYIDSDGDTFMEVYDAFGKYMGNCSMKRFQSVK